MSSKNKEDSAAEPSEILKQQTPEGEPWTVILSLTNQENEKLFTRYLNHLGLKLELAFLQPGDDGTNPPTSFDLAILDESRVNEKSARLISEEKADQEPLFAPVLILVSETTRDRVLVKFEQLADEILVKPVRKDELGSRVKNLLHLRQLSLELETKHRAITQNAHELISIVDRQGTYIYANRSYDRLLGHKPAELRGKRILHLLHPEDEGKLEDRVAQLMAKVDKGRLNIGEGERLERLRVKDRQGTYRWIEPVVIPLENSDGTGRFLVTARDVTDQKRAEEKLREERDKAKKYLDMAGTIIVLLDEKDRVTEINRRGCEVLGYEKDEVLGKDWYKNFVPERIRGEVLEEARDPLLEGKEEKAKTHENPVITSEGEERIIVWRNTVVRDDAGGIIGTLSSGRDITDRIRARERIEYLNDLLGSIGRINKLIVQEKGFETILREAREILLARESYGRVELFAFGRDDEGRIYVGPEDGQSWNLSPDGGGEGPECIKKALRKGGPVLVNHPEEICSKCDFHYGNSDSGYQTVVLPLSKGGTQEGAMMISLEATQVVQEKELDKLIEVSSDLAFAREKLRSEKKLEETTIGTLKALSRTVEAKDEYTSDHVDRVQKYALKLGEELGMSEEELDQLRYASVLHDVGKVRISGEILTKEGKLTDEEWEEIEKHPEIGEEIVRAVPGLERAATIIGQHQEKYDGTGYPEGLQGEEIELGARIIAVVDAWDAMRSDRPYRDALPKDVAVQELEENAGSQFDPQVVEKLLEIIKG